MSEKQPTNPTKIIQDTYSNGSRTYRKVEHGITFGTNKQSGDLGIHSDISSAVFVGKDRHLHITNDTSSTVYVAFGDSSVSSPGASAGIPVLANSTIRLCSGENEYVRASAAIHCVEISD